MLLLYFPKSNSTERRENQVENHKNLYEKPAYSFTECQSIFKAVQTAKKSIKENRLHTGRRTPWKTGIFTHIAGSCKRRYPRD